MQEVSNFVISSANASFAEEGFLAKGLKIDKFVFYHGCWMHRDPPEALIWKLKF